MHSSCCSSSLPGLGLASSRSSQDGLHLPCALPYGWKKGRSALQLITRPATENSPAEHLLPMQSGQGEYKRSFLQEFLCMKRQLFTETRKPAIFPLLFNLKLKFAVESSHFTVQPLLINCPTYRFLIKKATGVN